MSCFSRFCKKGTTVNKKLSIDENLYQDLTELSNSTYDASISKLVNAAIEDLITTKNVALYKKENTNQVSRSFLIREDFLNGLATSCKVTFTTEPSSTVAPIRLT